MNGTLLLQYTMLVGIIAACNTKRSGHETFTDVPPLDLRRDELPYLRMGKALGDLSLRGRHPHNRANQAPHAETTPLCQSTEKKTTHDPVWTSIVQYIQTHYPLQVLRECFVQTEWVTHKKHNDLKVCVQVSEIQRTKNHPSFDIKVTLHVDDSCTLTGTDLATIKQDIKRPITDIIFTSCGPPKP